MTTIDLASLRRVWDAMQLGWAPCELRCDKCGGFVKNLSRDGISRRIRDGIEECCGDPMRVVKEKIPTR